jgi:eukaryotic-like serine/threonine-protein kinase
MACSVKGSPDANSRPLQRASVLRFGGFPSRSTSLHTEAAGTAHPGAFGPFRVLHQIGAGALGPVFRAYDPEQDKLVAVKLFRLDLPPDRVHRLVAELQTLIDADLTHPAIAAPLAAGVTGVSAYLAQDFVVAESLDVFMQSHGPAGAAEAVGVAAQVAGALDVAAAMNIAHGALHPHDVLVSSDETRLTGLGLSRALEAVGAATAVRRPYTAPERAAGAAWDRRADVFSLAAIVYELLWARRVTGLGQQAAATLTEVAGGDLDALRRVFGRALAANPAERFATALEFAGALGDALAGDSPHVASSQLSRPLAPPKSDDRPLRQGDRRPFRRRFRRPP